MDKDINIYKQRGNTCAIACMMMALEYCGLMSKANWYDERRLYKTYASKYMTGVPFSAIAYHLAKKGLDVSIYHADENYFNNDRHILDKDIFDLALKEYTEYIDKAKKFNTIVVNNIDINIDLLKDKLDQDNILILAIQMNNNFHAVLLSGYDENNFYVCDPLYKEKQLKNYEEMDEYINTDIGKWFISVKER